MTPDCYKCKYCEENVGDAHRKCTNVTAKVKGKTYGIRSGWFFWPFNFDPVWLAECDGFEENK